MFAVIETGGKQYRVTPDEKIIVEKITGEIGSRIRLEKVLFIKSDQGDVCIGSPLINGAHVEVEILKSFKNDKVIIFKKRRRKNSRRKRGHRQQQTLLKILSIKS